MLFKTETLYQKNWNQITYAISLNCFPTSNFVINPICNSCSNLVSTVYFDHFPIEAGVWKYRIKRINFN